MTKIITTKTEQEWHDLRRTVITATESSVILGLNKWKTAKDVTDNKNNPKKIDNAYTWLGQQLEPIVVSATNKVLGTNFKLFEEKEGEKVFYIKEDIGIGATPDAIEGDILLECKTTKPHNYLRWADWPPVYYLCQLYTQLYCCDMQEGYISILSTNLTQKSEDLKLPISINRLTRDLRFDIILESEIKRYWETIKEGKQFRINRKAAKELELLLRINTSRIYIHE